MIDLQGAANAATVIGVPGGIAAAVVAVASLRSQARSQRLQAIITTNDFWQAVAEGTSKPVELSRSTVAAVRRVYTELAGDPAASSMSTGSAPRTFATRVPFVLGALLPIGGSDREAAPESESDYLKETRARTLALGYVRTILDGADSPPWLSSAARNNIRRDFAALDAAMETWVNRMNEVAELYEGDLIDRRRFVGKRSVALIQQLFLAEPYILWRNSSTPGRWGLRVLGLGTEARVYHWRSPLQRAAIRLRTDPEGYEETSRYPGFSATLGWIIGPGTSWRGPIAWLWAEMRIRRLLGSGFGWPNKSRQNQFVATLPRSPDSGLASAGSTWSDLVTDPAPVRAATTLLRRR